MGGCMGGEPGGRGQGGGTLKGFPGSVDESNRTGRADPGAHALSLPRIRCDMTGERTMFQSAARGMYLLAAVTLSLFALLFIGLSAVTVAEGVASLDGAALTSAMLDGVGMIVLAIAVFEIAKYLYEEEIVRERELRRADEARRTLTKFLTTIIIAASLEGLVLVFEARTSEISAMVYPTMLLGVVTLLVVGLGAFQWLARKAESIHVDPQASDDDEAEDDKRGNGKPENGERTGGA